MIVVLPGFIDAAPVRTPHGIRRTQYGATASKAGFKTPSACKPHRAAICKVPARSGRRNGVLQFDCVKMAVHTGLRVYSHAPGNDLLIA